MSSCNITTFMGDVGERTKVWVDRYEKWKRLNVYNGTDIYDGYQREFNRLINDILINKQKEYTYSIWERADSIQIIINAKDSLTVYNLILTYYHDLQKFDMGLLGLYEERPNRTLVLNKVNAELLFEKMALRGKCVDINQQRWTDTKLWVVPRQKDDGGRRGN